VLNIHDFLNAVRPVTAYQGGGLSTQGFNIQYADAGYYDKNFTNENDVNQFYIQAKYDTEILGHGVRGNFGGRYEDTKNTITTLDRTTPPTDSIGSATAFKTDEYTNKYNYFLPSAIFVADVTDNLILRGAYYKTYVRPHPRQYSPSTKVSPAQILNTSLSSGTTSVYDVSVAIGNNKLRPYLAESFDLSLEWYNRPNGLVSLAYFRKNITGRVATSTDPAIICPSDGSSWGFGDAVVGRHLLQRHHLEQRHQDGARQRQRRLQPGQADHRRGRRVQHPAEPRFPAGLLEELRRQLQLRLHDVEEPGDRSVPGHLQAQRQLHRLL
jgi:TonB-dependent receptor